jgi:hypothetical protein
LKLKHSSVAITMMMMMMMMICVCVSACARWYRNCALSCRIRALVGKMSFSSSPPLSSPSRFFSAPTSQYFDKNYTGFLHVIIQDFLPIVTLSVFLSAYFSVFLQKLHWLPSRNHPELPTNCHPLGFSQPLLLNIPTKITLAPFM